MKSYWEIRIVWDTKWYYEYYMNTNIYCEMERRMLKKIWIATVNESRGINSITKSKHISWISRWDVWRSSVECGMRMKDFHFVFCRVIFQPFESRWTKQFISIFLFSNRLCQVSAHMRSITSTKWKVPPTNWNWNKSRSQSIEPNSFIESASSFIK